MSGDRIDCTVLRRGFEGRSHGAHDVRIRELEAARDEANDDYLLTLTRAEKAEAELRTALVAVEKYAKDAGIRAAEVERLKADAAAYELHERTCPAFIHDSKGGGRESDEYRPTTEQDRTDSHAKARCEFCGGPEHTEDSECPSWNSALTEARKEG